MVQASLNLLRGGSSGGMSVNGKGADDGVPADFAPGATFGKVLAVVVTYNPGADLGRNLSALRAEVEAVVVIDNGSSDAEFVRQTAFAAGCRLVANGRNLGIAAALSQGAKMALREGFEWLATFDQDSLLPPRSIVGLLEVWERHPERSRIGVMAMSHRDRATGRDYHLGWDILEQNALWCSVRGTITSGSLIPIATFQKIGFFDDELFIDSVDHEFCLRCRRHGLLVIEGGLQVLDHAKGDASRHRLLWLTVPTANHSATRRYYITRNQLEMFRRYLFVDPIWVIASAFLLVCEGILIALYEQNRRAKFAAMLAGARDFLLRRFGARDGRQIRLPG
jgi:rhamnosyltransferase